MVIPEQLITESLDIWTSAIQMKSAAGRGKGNKLELYGIKKLRELILGTALAGGFSADKGKFDQPVADLLKNARESYSKSAGRKLKDYKQGDPLIAEFGLPPSWPWARVADLCDLQTGATPSRQKPEYFGGDIRWLVSGDINQGEIDDCEGRITEEGLSSSNCKILPAGTVLIALNGQGKTRASVAHLNVEATCNQSLVGMIPFDRNLIDSRFLLLALNYRYYEIRDITGQKQRRGLNMGLVAQLSIPLPPIGIQKSIVAKVDELMVLCDQLEQQHEIRITAHQTLVQTLLGALTMASERDGFDTAWSRIAGHFDSLFTTEWSIDQLKQSILQLAVMGKLVPQDPNDEPASELLKKIATKKAQLVKDGKIKKQKALPPIEDDEKPFELPEGWEWARLSDVASVIDPNPSHRMPNYVENGIPFISTENFREDGIDFSIGKKVEESVLEEQVSKFDIRDGSFAMSRIGTIGKTIFLPKERNYCMSHALCVISPYLDVFSHDFLKFVVSAESSLEQAHSGVQSIGVPDLGMGVIRSLLIPVPPLGAQDRVVSKVEKLLTLCDMLKTQMNTVKTTRWHLADAIAERAVA